MAAPLNSDLIKDTRTFVTLYNKSPVLKKIILENLKKNRVTFLGRPLKAYFLVISNLTSPEFIGKYKKDFKALTATLGQGDDKDFLVRYYKNPKEFLKLDSAIKEREMVFNAQEQEHIENIQQIEDESKRYEEFEKFVEKKQHEALEEVVPEKASQPILQTAPLNEAPEEVEAQQTKVQQNTNLAHAEKAGLSPSNWSDPTRVVATRPTFSSAFKNPRLFIKQSVFQIKKVIDSPVVKDSISKILVVSKKFVSKHMNPSVTFFSAGVGAVAGFSYGGLAGAGAGAFLGGSLSSIIIKTSDPEASSQIVEIMQEPNLSRVPTIRTRGGASPIPNLASLASNFTPVGRGIKVLKYALPAAVVIVLAILSPGGLDFLNSVAPLAPYNVAESAGLPGGGPSSGGAELNSCRFTRSGIGIPLQSSIVAGFFNEVSGKTGVPASVMASVARHEVPDKFSTITDQSSSVVNNYDNTTNASGDLGFMQINITHPQNIQANTIAGQRAAQKLGKTFISLGYCRSNPSVLENDRLDFCNIRDNIAIAAEVLNIKLGSGSWNNIDQLERAGCYYHNINCDYKDEFGKTHNYGKEVRQDYLNCQSGPSTPVPTLPPGSDYRAKIKQDFNIEFTGSFKNEVYQWSWEALSKAKSKTPRFFELLRQAYPGTVIVSATPGITTQYYTGTGRIGINVGTSDNNPNLYKQIFIHEIAHIIHGPAGNNCQGTYNLGICQAQAQDKDLLSVKSSVNSDEAFSEIISYYILDDLPSEQPTLTQSVKWPNIHPLKTGRYPAHIRFMQQILGGSF